MHAFSLLALTLNALNAASTASSCADAQFTQACIHKQWLGMMVYSPFCGNKTYVLNETTPQMADWQLFAQSVPTIGRIVASVQIPSAFAISNFKLTITDDKTGNKATVTASVSKGSNAIVADARDFDGRSVSVTADKPVSFANGKLTAKFLRDKANANHIALGVNYGNGFITLRSDNASQSFGYVLIKRDNSSSNDLSGHCMNHKY